MGSGQGAHDLPEYILRITREIWEQRGIASLRQHYAAEVRVRSPEGLVLGNEAVIATTLGTLAQYPDRTLLGEDVIWSETGAHCLSSHRILSTATAPDGAHLRYRIIADCAVEDDVIFDEWLIRDRGAIARQCGERPETVAARQASPAFTPAMDVAARYRSAGNDHPLGERYAALLGTLMRAGFSVVPTEYDRACHLELPGGVTGHGHADADRFWLGLRAAFPSARFTVEHRIGRNDVDLSPRAALRFSLQGRHDGPGLFGPPTGAEVYVMGLAHAEFGPYGLRREWVLFDEVAIWSQILGATG